MNRLQKKCFFVSAGSHLLLGLILLIGPAFLASRSQSDNMPTLDFVPAMTIDAAMSGGGTPTPTPPQPVQSKPQPQVVTPPPPQPKPPEQVKATPPPKPPENTKPNPDSLEAPKPPKQHKVEVNTTPINRSEKEIKDAEAARAKAAADAQRRANQINKTLANLKNGLSTRTTIEINGPGGGGPVYANFNQALKSIYERAWVVPEGVTDSDASVIVSVTIARDGTVISARITDPSGNKLVDRSVQEMLDRVKVAVPLPKDSTEDQRTISFKLNVEAKLLG